MINISDEVDDLFDKAVGIISQYDRVSASLLQRTLQVGYARAARIVDELENFRLISVGEGSKPRDVLIDNINSYLENPAVYVLNKPADAVSLKENEDNKHEVKIIPLNSLPDDFAIKEALVGSILEDDEVVFGISQGKTVKLSLKEIGNMLVVGSSTSGKEAFLDTLVFSLLYNLPPQPQFIFIDTRHDADLYQIIPNLLTPVIFDYDRTLSSLKWAFAEFERRNKLFAQAHTRSFGTYQEEMQPNLPRIIFVVKNMEDFAFSKEFKENMDVLISQSNKVGIHFILFTDRLSTNNVPASIQSNMPNRLVFNTHNKLDSKLAGVDGAEELVPKNEAILKIQGKESMKLENVVFPEEEIRYALGYKKPS